jgi:hypothetical protein
VSAGTRAPVIARIGQAVIEHQPLPMLPWFPAAFLSSTRGWSVTARGIYRELLDSQWEMGSVPADPAVLQKLIGATAAEWKSWSKVEPKFPLGGDGLRRNPNLEKIRRKSLALAARHRRGADKTNSKRWRPSVTRLPEGGSDDAS